MSEYKCKEGMIDNRMVKDDHQQGIKRVLQRKEDRNDVEVIIWPQLPLLDILIRLILKATRFLRLIYFRFYIRLIPLLNQELMGCSL